MNRVENQKKKKNTTNLFLRIYNQRVALREVNHGR